MTSHAGKEFVLPHISHPTQTEIDDYHAQYVEMMQQLFNRHKTQDEKPLEIW
jgi:hypothetical protein